MFVVDDLTECKSKQEFKDKTLEETILQKVFIWCQNNILYSIIILKISLAF